MKALKLQANKWYVGIYDFDACTIYQTDNRYIYKVATRYRNRQLILYPHKIFLKDFKGFTANVKEIPYEEFLAEIL